MHIQKENKSEFFRSDNDINDVVNYDRNNRRSNYIPQSYETNNSREEWHFAYKEQLIDIHRIIVDLINIEFPKNKIDWDNVDFNNLSKVIYNCSSKNISPYL